MTAICVEDVHKTYGKGARAVHALRGVSLTVAPGEIYGLLGRNGAGKTTLVKILLDLVRAQRGEARLLDRSSRDPRARRAIGYLPEDHRFPDYQTAESALRFYAALSGADPRAVRDAIPRLLEQVDLTSAAKKKVRSFSKGMKQRLGLAQALVHDPQILFLDEPTDGVDPVGRAEIRRLLEDQRARGRTIFLNSHLLGEVELICDRVGILSNGQLVREGTIEQLTSAEALFDLRTDPPLDAAAIEAVRRRATSLEVRENGRLEIGVAQLEDIDVIIDELRTRRIGVRHLTGKRMTLEEVFLEAVDERQEATA